jgi:hypothetical protein
MGRTSLVVGIIVLASCGAIKETEDEASRAKLKEYEASFRPSDYDQPLRDFFPDANLGTAGDSGSISPISIPQPLELTQGYRVQVFATTDFDEATQTKATVEAQFPDEWFYLVYDSPTYKLRAGNFIERYEADRFAKTIAEKHYRDAWVVPERVYKNPPPRSAQTQDMQK